MRTPWAPVTITAAYRDPGVVPALTISPALAHGSGPSPSSGRMPASDVTRAVMVPFPGSVWSTR
jgi:hypothetical protein